VVTYTNTTKGRLSIELQIGLADNRVMTLTVPGNDGAPPVLSMDQLIQIAQQATDRIK
jgi:hypothetical protein